MSKSKKIETMLRSIQEQQLLLDDMIKEVIILNQEDRVRDQDLHRSLNSSDTVSREEVKLQVIAVIDDEARRNSADPVNRTLLQAGDETLNLASDLNINDTRRRALSVDYTKISKKYPKGKFVSITSAENATTVKKAINAVWKRAKG